MSKHNLITNKINELINDPDVLDESIYVVYQFLSELLLEFES